MYKIDDLLNVMVEAEASDLYVTLGAYPMLKIKGEVLPLEKEIIVPEALEKLKTSLLNTKQLNEFKDNKELDYTYSLSGIGRFRINFFRQRNSDAFVVRRIVLEIKTLEDLQLPPLMGELANRERGLILVVGSTGCGKSTTLAAMLDHRNREKSGHILTLEDPVEFLHNHNKSIVNQREVGQDTKSFHHALRSALREAPSMLMLGEIRDETTMSAALNFAETGHLVLSTLHANNASQTMERILSFYEIGKHDMINLQFSQTFAAIIAQRLIPTADDSRTAIFEILLSTARARDLLKRGEFELLRNTITRGASEGMRLFDDSLFGLYQEKKITEDTALIYADRPTDLLLKIRSTYKHKKTRNIELLDEEPV